MLTYSSISFLSGLQSNKSLLQRGVSILCFFLILSKLTIAQTDSKSDSLTQQVIQRENKVPLRAMWMSACLPGLGQMYNKRYWKVPVIYAGFGALSFFALVQHNQMLIYKNAITNRFDNNPETVDQFPNVSTDMLVKSKKEFKAFRDYFIAGAGLWYVLNITDAFVDAHLKSFDEKINESLSWHIKPKIITSGQAMAIGMSLRFSWH